MSLSEESSFERFEFWPHPLVAITRLWVSIEQTKKKGKYMWCLRVHSKNSVRCGH